MVPLLMNCWFVNTVGSRTVCRNNWPSVTLTVPLLVN